MSTIRVTNIKHESSASNNIVLDSSGNLAVQAGSASTPAIQATGDSNTGIFFPAADTIAFAEGGAEAVRIDSSANLKFNSGYGSVATAYGCRAWVNFNGGGTVAIRASGNVSSITDNGSGDYTINFATAMPDGNYCAAVSNAGSTFSFVSDALIGIKSVAASSLRIFSTYIYGTDRGSYDQDPVMVAIFR